jgi:hypothetical protein
VLVWSENEWAAEAPHHCTATKFGRAREALMALGGGGGINADPYNRAAYLTNLDRNMHFDGLMLGPRQSARVQQQAAPAQPPPRSRAAGKAAASSAALAAAAAKAARKVASQVKHAVRQEEGR